MPVRAGSIWPPNSATPGRRSWAARWVGPLSLPITALARANRPASSKKSRKPRGATMGVAGKWPTRSSHSLRTSFAVIRSLRRRAGASERPCGSSGPEEAEQQQHPGEPLRRRQRRRRRRAASQAFVDVAAKLAAAECTPRPRHAPPPQPLAADLERHAARGEEDQGHRRAAADQGAAGGACAGAATVLLLHDQV